MTAPNAPKTPASPEGYLLLGAPQLIDGEDTDEYNEIFSRVMAVVKPADVIEEIYDCDFVDLQWDVLRWRRLSAKYLNANAYKGLVNVLEMLGVDGDDLAAGWAARKPRAMKRVNRLLESAGLTMHAVMAETLYECLEETKILNAMIAMAEARRNTALFEIDRHRAALACALRRTAQQMENAEQRTLSAQRAEPKGPS